LFNLNYWLELHNYADILSSKLAICSTENSSKLLSLEVLFLAKNAPQAVWWSGSAWTLWGAYSASPEPLAGIKAAPCGRRLHFSDAAP